MKSIVFCFYCEVAFIQVFVDLSKKFTKGPHRRRQDARAGT